ncbi:thiol:disulfide interchange protein DsbG [Paraburkholderia sp.]|uniref:thiol:disulfide interchange protein DsbG n=1 Tax=Paraburkholderia sp. TaxID=1926495 RepID=UPI0025EA1253|nr:thiol:disulfide interchange protein DsbG [Paraburkholderia sp.]
MNIRLKSVSFAAGAIALIALSSVAIVSRFASAADQPVVPPGLQKFAESAGVKIVGRIAPAPAGMTGWAAYKGQQPLAFYSTSDGKYFLAGTLFDAQGHDVTKGALIKVVGGQLSGGVWSQLEKSHWIREGNPNSPRIMYVFTDPNCPYCSRLWSDTQPWVKAGKVQIRNILVGILTPTSYGKAAALLSAKDPQKAFHDHQMVQFGINRVSEPGQMKSLNDSGIAPLENVDARIRKELDENQQLMSDLGIDATPALYWKDDDGTLRSSLGEPRNLASVLGLR